MSDLIDDGLKEAIGLFRKRRFGESTRILTRLNEQHGEDSHRSFLIGRNYLGQENQEQATNWFKRSIEARPHQWSFFQLALAEHQGGDALAAGEWTARFLECGKGDAEARGFTGAHIDTVLRIADAVFTKDPILAVAIYEKADAIGIADYRSSLRIVESLIASRSADKALEKMKAVRDGHTLDGEGFLCLSRLHQLRGKPLWARDAVNKAMATEPDSPRVLMGSAERFLEMALLDEAEVVLDTLRARAKDLEAGEAAGMLGLELQLATQTEETGRLAALFVSIDFGPQGERIKPEMLAVAKEVQTFIETRFSGKLPEVNGLLQFYARMRMGEEADALLKKIRDTEIFSHPLIAIRRLEVCCIMLDLDAAETIYDQYFAGKKLDRWQCLSVIRFLAERKRWSDAEELLEYALATSHELPGQKSQLLRVARRASRRHELLAILDEIVEKGEAKLDANALSFRQLLIDDLCVEAGAVALTRDAAADAGHGLSGRNAFLSSRERDSGVSLRGRTALYLCTDKAYFFGVLTFLASYATHNSAYAGKVKLIIFLADDVPPTWDRILSDFGAKIRQPIEILREKDFTVGDTTQHGSWGFFTGGAGLSRAAYFRLYAARHLQSTGEFDRLCYIDSDILCQGDLGDLFAYDLGSLLMGARCEDAGPQVDFAAAKNGIDPEVYFNSGVLLFDLSKEQTMHFLDQAIHLGEHESHRLFFLDQCALNIAFENRFSPLPPEFNYFIPPYRRGGVDLSFAKLLHFVAAPKPWDISYEREFRDLWSPYAGVVRLLLNPGDYGQVVIAANGGQSVDGAQVPQPVPGRARGGAKRTTSNVDSRAAETHLASKHIVLAATGKRAQIEQVRKPVRPVQSPLPLEV